VEQGKKIGRRRGEEEDALTRGPAASAREREEGRARCSRWADGWAGPKREAGEGEAKTGHAVKLGRVCGGRRTRGEETGHAREKRAGALPLCWDGPKPRRAMNPSFFIFPKFQSIFKWNLKFSLSFQIEHTIQNIMQYHECSIMFLPLYLIFKLIKIITFLSLYAHKKIIKKIIFTYLN
jgi:hypothetical protein